jgi:hypothetical protein
VPADTRECASTARPVGELTSPATFTPMLSRATSTSAYSASTCRATWAMKSRSTTAWQPRSKCRGSIGGGITTVACSGGGVTPLAMILASNSEAADNGPSLNLVTSHPASAFAMKQSVGAAAIGNSRRLLFSRSTAFYLLADVPPRSSLPSGDALLP